jgi:hypothetical protein
LAKKNVLEGVYFIGMSPSTTSHILQDDGTVKVVLPNLKSSAEVYNRVLELGFDAVNSFGKRRAELLYSGKWMAYIKDYMVKYGLKRSVTYDYGKAIKGFFSPEDRWENVFPTIMPQYDRTARIGKAEGIYINSTPANFDKHVSDVMDVIKNKNPEHQLVFLDAWNEWAEGCYVEPDTKYGHGFLDVLTKYFKK